MLRRSAHAITATVLFLFVNFPAPAQDSGSTEPKSDDAALCFSTTIRNSETKWFRRQLGIISICIPESMVRKRSKGCTDTCYIFENDDLFFDIDFSVSAWRPTLEKRYPSFSAASKLIDGRQASVWSFNDTGKYKYAAGVNFILGRGQIGMGAYLFSKTSDPKPIADRMFNSIKFVKIPQ